MENSEKIEILTNLGNERVSIEFENLSLTIRDGTKTTRLILKGVSGKFKSGQLTAILGPSGAGKSTLLNILAGYKCEGSTGNILVNGKKRNVEKFRKVSRYIMQNDYVQLYLTVQESMTVAANLKLGSNATKEKKDVMIEEILELLRLKNCRNTRTIGLSGGERKRLSIALEMLNNPPVIFLDEPTTGLDDVACSQCIRLLKLLAKEGRTVICAVHTPSAKLFSIFDHIYIVSQGECAYQGQPSAVIPFLDNMGLVCPTSYNPADFIMEVCSQEYGDFQKKMVSIVDNGKLTLFYSTDESLNESKRKSIMNESHNEELDVSHYLGSTFWEQVKVLTVRMWIQNWRDKSGFTLKIIVYVLLALLIGNIYIGMGNDGSKTLYNFGFFYVCIIFLMYVPMIPVLLWFPLEIKTLKREHFNKWYSLGAYFMALTLSSIPLQMIFTLLYVGITYPLTAQPLEANRIFFFYLVCFITSLVAESMGILVGGLLGVVNALFVGTIIKVPMMLFATYGFGSGSATIPQWIRIGMYFSYLRYSMEGIMSTMLSNRPIIPCPDDKQWCFYTDVSFFLKEMGMAGSVLWIDIVVLICYLLFFKAVGYYLLKQRLSPNKFSRATKVVLKLVKSHFGP